MSFFLTQALVFRNLAQNPLRTLFTVMGIALGVAVFLAIQLLNRSALAEFEKSVTFLSGDSNLEIVSETGQLFDEHILSGLTWLWHENSRYTPVVSFVAALVSKVERDEPELVEVLGLDFMRDTPLEGWEFTQEGTPKDFLDIFKANCVYVSEGFARAHGIRLGDTLPLQLTDSQENVKVSGIYRTNSGTASIAQNLILGDISVIQDLFHQPERINRIQLTVPSHEVSLFQKRLQAQMHPGLVVQTLAERQKQLEKMLASFHINLQALSMVSLLVGMFLIYNTMSISILRRRVEIGTLRTLGLTRGQIFRLFLTEASVLGIIGMALGVALGVGLAQGGMAGVSKTLQTVYGASPLRQLDLSWVLLSISGLVGFLVTLLAAFPPIWEATQVQPALASRPSEESTRAQKRAWPLLGVGLLFLLLAAWACTWPSVDRIPVGGYAAAFLLMLGFAAMTPFVVLQTARLIKFVAEQMSFWRLQLAFANLQRALAKTSVAVASLMVSVALVVSIATMVGSFRSTVTDWVNQTLKADLFIEPTLRTYSPSAPGLSPEIVASIKKLPGVEAVDDFVERPISFRGEPTRLGAGNFQVLQRYGNLRFVGGQSHQSVFERVVSSPHNIVVSESFATRFNIRPGQMLSLPTPRGPLRLEIGGVYYDYASELGYIVMDKALYRQYFNDASSTSMAVYLAHGEEPEQLRQRILNTIGKTVPLTIRQNRELRHEVLRIFDNTFAITNVLLIISIVIAALSVAITLFTLVLELEAHLTLLRYLGAQINDIRRIILIQAGVFGALGGTLGILNGYFLSLILIFIINKQAFGWTLFFEWSWVFIIKLFLALLVGSVAAGWIPAQKQVTLLKPEVLRRA